MDLKVILFGFTIIGIAIVLSLPSIILKIAGSDITSQEDLLKITSNAISEGFDDDVSERVFNQVDKALDFFKSIPLILFFIGIIIVIIGFKIDS